MRPYNASIPLVTGQSWVVAFRAVTDKSSKEPRKSVSLFFLLTKRISLVTVCLHLDSSVSTERTVTPMCRRPCCLEAIPLVGVQRVVSRDITLRSIYRLLRLLASNPIPACRCYQTTCTFHCLAGLSHVHLVHCSHIPLHI